MQYWHTDNIGEYGEISLLSLQVVHLNLLSKYGPDIF